MAAAEEIIVEAATVEVLTVLDGILIWTTMNDMKTTRMAFLGREYWDCLTAYGKSPV